MSTLFAFLHHLCAFTLVSAVAIEFALFIVIGLLSIIPTREFLSWNGALRAGQVPVLEASRRRLVISIIHGELLAIVIIVLCAAIMARGRWV
jgi:putative membrane protein